MVFDTRGMVQHYKRIYNAKPSPEIARTRASSANKRRPARPGSNSSGALARRSTSFQSLNQEQFNHWNSDQWLGPYDLTATSAYSQDNFDYGARQPSSVYARTPQPEQKPRPYSAIVANSRGQQMRQHLLHQQQQQQQQQQHQQQQLVRQKSNLLQRSSSQAQSDINSSNNRANGRTRPFSANVVSSATSQRKQDLRPKRRRLRPASTSGHYQSSSSAAEDARDYQRVFICQPSPYSKSQHLPDQMASNLSPSQDRLQSLKKFSSMHDLHNPNSRLYQDSPHRIQSTTSMDQIGLRRTTSLSERIDSFLQAVQVEQQHLLLLHQQQRQVQLGSRRSGVGSTSNKPSMSSVVSAGNVSSRKASTAFSVSSLPSKHRHLGPGPAMRARPLVQHHRIQQQQSRQVPAAGETKQQPDPRPQLRPVPIRSKRQGQFNLVKQQSIARRKTNTSTPAPIDTNNIVSKLKQDRNYQPPRHKRQVILMHDSQHQIQKQQRQQSSSDNGEDYDDDFEAEEDLEVGEEEEEEEDTDTAMMRKKQAWLYDQFRRARARQRAAMMVKREESGVEKASSKDSAYGYSGGETSRMHTREPTPDYQHNLYGALSRTSQQNSSNNNRPRIKPKILPNNKPAQQGHNSSRHSGPLVPKHVLEPQSKFKPGVNEDYIMFLSSVTNDILKSGNFTVPSIKRVLEQHLEHNKGKYNLSKREVEELIVTLRQELGLEPSKDKTALNSSSIAKGIQDILKTTPSTPARVAKSSNNVIVSSRNEKFLQQQQSTSSSYRTGAGPSAAYKNVISSARNGRSDGSPNVVRISISQDDDEEDLMLQLLRDETDLDDSTVEEILRAATGSNQPSPSHRVQQQHQPQGKQKSLINKPDKVSGLFKSLNISNLDVSFNASFTGQMKKREELNQEKALLIKSFALQGKERTIRAWNEENKQASPISNKSPKTNAKTADTKVAKSASKSTAKLQPKMKEDQDNTTPRSSMLYQTDDESKDEEVSEDLHEDEDQDSETIGEEESVAEDENL